MELADKLQRLLEEKHLTQVQLAGACGLTQGAIVRYLDKSTPASNIGVKMAEFLGVSAAWLFDDAAGFPAKTTAEMLNTSDLVAEFSRRSKDQRARLLAAIQQAKGIDWKDIISFLAKCGKDPFVGDKFVSRAANPPTSAIDAALWVATFLMALPSTSSGLFVAVTATTDGGTSMTVPNPDADDILDIMYNAPGVWSMLQWRWMAYVSSTDRENIVALLESSLADYDTLVKAGK